MGNKNEVHIAMYKHLSKRLAYGISSVILPLAPDFLSFHFQINIFAKHLLMCSGSWAMKVNKTNVIHALTEFIILCWRKDKLVI